MNPDFNESDYKMLVDGKEFSLRGECNVTVDPLGCTTKRIELPPLPREITIKATIGIKSLQKQAYKVLRKKGYHRRTVRKILRIMNALDILLLWPNMKAKHNYEVNI